MKISELIKSLQWEIETYGDAEVRVDWNKHKQIDEKTIFINRVIGNYEMLENFTKEELSNMKSTESDGLWIQNYPY